MLEGRKIALQAELAVVQRPVDNPLTTLDFKEFQVAHYTQRLTDCPHFVIDSNGVLQHNTQCLRFLRQQLFNLKKP